MTVTPNCWPALRDRRNGCSSSATRRFCTCRLSRSSAAVTLRREARRTHSSSPGTSPGGRFINGVDDKREQAYAHIKDKNEQRYSACINRDSHNDEKECSTHGCFFHLIFYGLGSAEKWFSIHATDALRLSRLNTSRLTTPVNCLSTSRVGNTRSMGVLSRPW